jgi:hypothetical protein
MIYFVYMKALILTLIAAAAAATGCAGGANTANSGVANSPANAATAKTPAPDTAKEIPFPDVPRITLEEAKADFDAGTAVFIDTHAASTYAANHIKGAINVPANLLAANESKIPKGKKIIAYCS